MEVTPRVTRKAEGEGGPSIALQQRILRGINLYAEKGHEIVWLGEDRCRVPSCSHEGRSYLVTLSGQSERCQCKDYGRAKLGACKHTVAALISWAKQVSYTVRRRHDSRRGEYVWDVVEIRAGVERVVFAGLSCSVAYHEKWILEGIGTGEAA